MSPSKLVVARVVAAVSIALTAVVGCRGDSGGAQPPATQSPPAREAATQEQSTAFSPALVERVTGILKSSGVEVLADRIVFEQGVSSVAGFAVSEFQARNMAIEIANNRDGGFLGADLDEIAPLARELPSISYFIAAWMALGSTPAAKEAAALMGQRDWSLAPYFVYPSVVLAAFVGDAMRYGSSDAPPARIGFRLTPDTAPLFGRGGQPRLLLAGLGASLLQDEAGPCGAINNFINGVLSNVFNKIKLAEGSGVGGFFASLINKAIDLVGVVVKGAIKVITAPIAEGMRVAIGIVGVVSYAGSLLKPWKVEVSANPSLIHWAVDNQTPPEGTFTAKPNDSLLPNWPPALVSCIHLVDPSQDLPSTNADVGSPVKWVGAGPGLSMIKRLHRDEALPPSKVANYRYVITRKETKEDVEKGKIVDDLLTIEVTFERSLITQMKKLLTSLFSGPLTSLAASILSPILKPNIDKITGKLESMLRPKGMAQLTIRHHASAAKGGCPLFSVAEAIDTLGHSFDRLALLPPTGCGVAVGNGPTFGYQYSDTSCQVEGTAVMLVGITWINVGPWSYYLHAGNSHILGFPSIKAPNKCVIISATPLSAFRGGRIVQLAALMRPRS